MRPLRRSSIVIAFAIVIGAKVGLAPLPAHSDSDQRRPAEIVKQLFKQFNAHNLEGLQSVYASDAILTSPDFDEPRIGPAGVRKTYGALFRVAPDVQDCVMTLVAQEHRAAAEFITRSTGKNAFMFQLATFFEFRGGKIVRDTTYFDTKSETGSERIVRKLSRLWATYCGTERTAPP